MHLLKAICATARMLRCCRRGRRMIGPLPRLKPASPNRNDAAVSSKDTIEVVR